MIGLIMKACPGVFVLGLISTILGAAHSFLFNAYLYKYALNALQQGKELKMELSRYVQSEIPQNLSFNDKALDLRSGA